MNVLDGGEGNDFLRGYGGDDSLTGGVGNDTFEWGIGDGSDTIFENRGAGIDRLVISDFVELDDFTEDLSFRREGRDLVVDLTMNQGLSEGTMRVSSQLWGAYRVETLEFNGIDVDLRELFAQLGPNNTQFRVLSDSTEYGFLTVPV